MLRGKGRAAGALPAPANPAGNHTSPAGTQSLRSPSQTSPGTANTSIKHSHPPTHEREVASYDGKGQVLHQLGQLLPCCRGGAQAAAKQRSTGRLWVAGSAKLHVPTLQPWKAINSTAGAGGTCTPCPQTLASTLNTEFPGRPCLPFSFRPSSPSPLPGAPQPLPPHPRVGSWRP